MLQQPVESDWIERLAGSEDHWVDAMPGAVHIGPMSDEQLHHGRSRTIQTGAHERRIASFVNVTAVVDKPLCYKQPSFVRFSGPATLSGPRQRPISAIADGCMFQFRVFRNKVANLSKVFCIDCSLQVFRQW